MHARAEEPRPALMLCEEDLFDDAATPALWQDFAVSLVLVFLLGLAFVLP